jgi:hypothetical protein
LPSWRNGADAEEACMTANRGGTMASAEAVHDVTPEAAQTPRG